MTSETKLRTTEQLVELLRKLTGWKIQLESNTSLDGIIRIDLNGHRYSFVIELKRQFSSSMIPRIVEQLRAYENRFNTHVLLATDYMMPSYAEALRKAGMSYVDLKGNLHLEVPGLKLWFIEAARALKEQPPIPSVPKRQSMNSTGARLVFELLNDSESVNKTYRDLAQKTGVSLGSIKANMDWLRSKGFLRITGRGPVNRIVANKQNLLNLWVEAYVERLRPKIQFGRYTTEMVGDSPGKAHIRFRAYSFPKPVSWGSESGASMLLADESFKPGSMTVYLYSKEDLNVLLAHNKLSRAANGELEILGAFWKHEDEVKPGIAPPLVIYADLMSSGSSRCWNAAREIFNRYLKEKIEQ